MKKGRLIAIGTAVLICAGHSALAQYFTNDLTDASSVAIDFNENLGPDGIWSYTNDYALAQDGTMNTVLQGGAVIDHVSTNDTDDARSYLATVFSNYTDKSWVAHIGVETVNVAPHNYIFFGLGKGVPNGSYYNEPTDGDHVFVFWRSGTSNSKISVKRNGTSYSTGSWQGDPGYDIYMTYNHVNKTVKFEIDNWNGGRFSDIDIDTGEYSTADYLNDTNNMRIFFGGNATMTFRDFDVYEIDAETPPATPQNVYTVISNMAVEVKWDAAGGAESYDVKRTVDSGSNYVTLASGVTNLTYVDATVETNEIYYYVVSATNQFGVSANSDEATGFGLPYDIIGPVSSYGAGSSLEKDNLFDKDVNTFYDTTVDDSWAGLDFGAGNAQQILEVNYVLRPWSHAYRLSTGAVFQASSTADFSSDVVILFTVPTNVVTHPNVNSVTIANTSSFRYVRLLAPSNTPLFAFAELDIVNAENLQATTNGTRHAWLDSYYDVDTLFGGNYEAADLSDTDGDGLLAWEENVAGTIPTDSNSVLVVNSIAPSGTDLVLSWQSVEGKSYSIVTNTSLIVPAPGTAVSGITGLETETSYTTTVSGASAVFYEIGVE